MITATADERDIHRAIVGFARAMDARDWAAIEDIAVPDATADLGQGLAQGRDAMIAVMRRFLDDCGPTQHMVSNVLIDVDESGGTAESRAYVSDMHLGTGALRGESFRTLGDYHDRWAKIDGRWWMTHRTKTASGTLGNLAVLGDLPDGVEVPSAGAGQAGVPSSVAITNLLHTYAEHMDAGRLEDAAALFRHARVRAGGRALGEPELLALWRSSVKLHEDGTPRTKHVITNPILDVDEDAGRAACRSYYTVLQCTDTVPLQIIAAGRYHDEFERAGGAESGGAWRFTARDYSLMDFAGNLGDHLLMEVRPPRG